MVRMEHSRSFGVRHSLCTKYVRECPPACLPACLPAFHPARVALCTSVAPPPPPPYLCCHATTTTTTTPVSCMCSIHIYQSNYGKL